MINRDLQKLVARDDGAGNSGYARGAMWRETPSAIGSRIRVASWLGLPGLTLPVFDGASRTFWSSHDVRIDTGGTSSTASVTGKSAPAGTIDNSPPIGSNQQERKHALQHSRRRDTKLVTRNKSKHHFVFFCSNGRRLSDGWQASGHFGAE
jgi:hypothetical protein